MIPEYLRREWELRHGVGASRSLILVAFPGFDTWECLCESVLLVRTKRPIIFLIFLLPALGS